MNDKIKSLLNVCGMPNEDLMEIYSDENKTFYMKKFAELIVKECVRVCEDDLLDEYMRKCFAAQEEGILYAAVSDCSTAMKQHFGIEE